MIKRTIIIGNGFDLNLGLKTSWTDFIGSPYFQAIYPYNSLSKYIFKKFKTCNWVDVESALFEYANQTSDYRTLYKEYWGLKESLCNYLSSIDTSKFVDGSEAYIIIDHIFLQSLKLGDELDTTILNFNYTNIVQRIIEERLSWSNMRNREFKMQFKNVHGTLSYGNIILGYNGVEKLNDDHNFFIEKSANKNYAEYNEILLGCDQVIIIGHSLGKSDEIMFKSLFSATSTKKQPRILIFYYKKAGYDSLKRRIVEMTGGALNAMTNKRKIRLEDIDNFFKDINNFALL